MFKWAARVWVIVLMIAFVTSLSFNVAVVAFASFSSMVASAYDALTGTASAYSTMRNRAQAAEVEVGELVLERDRLVSRANDLDGQLELRNAQNGQLIDEIATRDAEIARLSDDLARRSDDVLRNTDTVIYRGARTNLAEAVTDTSGRIARRTAVAATRNSSSVVAEAIPYLGIAAILAVTAYDLKDSCDTIKDLHELDVAIDPNNEFGEDEAVICGLSVPTKDEVWEAVKNSSVDAWQHAREYLPALPEYRLPSLRDLAFWP